MKKNKDNNRILMLIKGLLFLIWLFFFSSGLSVAQTSKNLQTKGFHIDLRAQVMTMGALKKTATELAGFGINTIVMEWEASYPYQNHATISNKKAYTRTEVSSFIQHCDSLGIEVIPLQQCFGHVEYILRHSRYAHLKEDGKEISQLCPLKTEASKELFTELFKDMISMHNSDYIHIGGDETQLLGHCSQCSKKVEQKGISKLYIDYIKLMCDIVTDLGKTPVIWADMVLQYPEALHELPEEVVLVDWNYGWDINFFGNIDNLLESNNPVWGSSAIRSHPDDWFLECWERHFNNIKDFIPYAKEAGYKGIVMTSWSTSGLYGFSWDIGWDVIDMQQIRNVYPLSGFRIIIAAYAQALNSTKSLDPKDFVTDYARKEFGLSNADGKKLWNVLTANPTEVRYGQATDGSPLIDLRDSIMKTREILNGIIPLKNKEEFDHYRLMVDMRLYYMNIKLLEEKYNAKSFGREETAPLLIETEQLLKTAKLINERFSSLNNGYLKESEITEQNFIRNQRLNILYDRLKNQQ